jgi:serine/threonine-protein phosphatase 2A activator
MPSAEPIPDGQIPTPPPDLSNRLPKLIPRRKQDTANEAPLKPPPPTPALPSPPNKHDINFQHPTRRILSKKDHELFLASPTHDLITAFVFGLSDSVRDKTVSAVAKDPRDAIIDTLLQILQDAQQTVAQCPAEDAGGSRFGNKAFVTFLDKIETQLKPWHDKLTITDGPAQDEVSTYLFHSFGNKTRIDYGSGHELNFLIWLLCLNRLNLLSESTFPQLALIVFPRYLAVMRVVQSTYYLEPAGSHGVWGLDDYQFAPFLFGSAQLIHHAHIRPMSIHKPLILEECSPDFLYLEQVAYVNSVKNVDGLRWHSPMLDDISSAKNWQKVEAGMKKMFVAEVLGKLPVMQHFMFGGLVPAVDGMSTEDESNVAGEMEEAEGGQGCVDGGGGGMKHVHDQSGKTWDDCCGIKVPSAIGAMQEEMKKRQGGESLRRLPFD